MTNLQQQPERGNGKAALIAPKKKKERNQVEPTPLVTVTLELVTPGIADRWSKVGEFQFQRKQNDAHVEELASEMNLGQFEQGTTINIAEIMNTSSYVVINGQHTLLAIVLSGMPQWLTVVRKQVKTLKEAGVAYTRIDINAPRHPNQRLKALDLPELANFTSGDTASLIAALKLLLANFENKLSGTVAGRRGPDRAIFKSAERWAQGVTEYRDPIRKYITALEFSSEGQQRRRLMRSAVLAIALATMRYQPKRAWEFWASVAAEDGLRANTPERRLSNWLRENKGWGSAGAATKQAKFIAQCWKKHWDGEEMRSVRPLEPDLLGVTIVGTPFKARERS